MTADKTGGPAFPVPREVGTHGQFSETVRLEGMTLRDYFAAKVLGAITGQPDPRTCPTDQPFREWQVAMAIEDARTCYAYADAMLAERSKSA